MITDILKGETSSVLTVQISDVHADKIQQTMSHVSLYRLGYSGLSLEKEGYIACDYAENFLPELEDAIYDGSSKILSVFDKDATNFTYTYDGLQK